MLRGSPARPKIVQPLDVHFFMDVIEEGALVLGMGQLEVRKAAISAIRVAKSGTRKILARFGRQGWH